jgi:hypothetical protein
MMRKRQIFSALVFGFVLAITGCGDDATSGGGTGGSGTAGTGGSGTAGTGGSGTAGTGGSGTAGTGGSGTAGTGGSGTGGTGGGNGAMVTSCDAICNGPCPFPNPVPILDPDDPNCQATCELEEGLSDDDCYAESKAFLDCAAPDCEADDYVRCGLLFDDWDMCSPAGL